MEALEKYLPENCTAVARGKEQSRRWWHAFPTLLFCFGPDRVGDVASNMEIDLYWSVGLPFLRGFTVLCNPVSVYVCSGDEYTIFNVIVVHTFTFVTGY